MTRFTIMVRDCAAVAMAAAAILLPAAGRAADAPTFKTLYNFQAPPDGVIPSSGLTRGPDGAFYGTTLQGGFYYDIPQPDPDLTNPEGYGTVYKLTPPARGQTAWTEQIIYSFSGFPDGAEPTGNLTIDAKGNIFGTTSTGGISPSWAGTVFELSPPSAGQTAWTKRTIYVFDGNYDIFPNGDLLLDRRGALYGTTATTVFKLTPPAAGQRVWTYTNLWNPTVLPGNPPRGMRAGLVMDRSGAVYATSQVGGGPGYGTIFKLTPPVAGSAAWTETTLYQFTGGTDGSYPSGKLEMDAFGNLYGEVAGNVFELSPPRYHGGSWTETTLAVAPDGYGESSPDLVLSGGALYGVFAIPDVVFGLPPNALVYKLSRGHGPSAAWTFTSTYTFPIQDNLVGDLTLDPCSDTLYGTIRPDGEPIGTMFGSVFAITLGSTYRPGWGECRCGH